MTDTKCPHCGEDLKCRLAGKDMYECATIAESGVTLCRDVVCLTRELDKAKELLKEAAEVIHDAVDMLGCGDDYDSLYVKNLAELHRKIQAAL